ncbi:hypothetical protein BGZ99_003666 [Dissophora globulifera]|uniref:GATA-type domain-containing protein n=1 Tax=Dissophora globulifera TaxID=979702 RepID=A0A9P6V0C5_9FUNG|nr:hypothetical protein BGZ99_003666 [Dissophora globulifera]
MDSLTNQEVLDYTSFSDESDSPVLSLQSFSSQQQSPDLDAYAFADFEPMVAASSDVTLPTFSSTEPAAVVSGAMDARPSASETARQAALLHAYLTAQDVAYRAQLQLHQQPQQQRWDFAALAQLEKVQDAAPTVSVEQEQQSVAQERTQAQRADAEILSRYLAQVRDIKEEDDMDRADAVSEIMHCPSSPSSESSNMERSPSPEAIALEDSANGKHQRQSNSLKSSRQLVCFNCNVTQTPLWRRTPDRKHSLCNACGLYYKQYGAHRPLNVRNKLPSVLADPRLSAMPYGRSVSCTRGSSPSSPESSGSSSDCESDSSRNPDEEHRLLPDLSKMYADALLRSPSDSALAKKTTPPLMTAKQGIECSNCSQTQTPLWRKNDAGEPICNACGLYAKLHNRARPVTMRKSKITRRRRDWGGNLAHQAKAQAQALALFHAQVQAQVEAQVIGRGSSVESMQSSGSSSSPVSIEASMVEEMSRRALELGGRSTDSSVKSPVVQSSDSEEDQQQQDSSSASVVKKLSGNLILDEHKFSDMIGQMNAHQMNRFLSVLESRCGLLRNKILANTEGSAQDSSLDSLF